MILSYDCTWVSVGRRRSTTVSEDAKARNPDKRSWWIDPSGQVIDAGYDHGEYIEQHPEIFGEPVKGFERLKPALSKNWIRIAYWGGVYFLQGNRLNREQLKASQSILDEVPGTRTIKIMTPAKAGVLSPEDFLSVDSPAGLFEAINLSLLKRRMGASDSDWMKRVYPEKRSWWINPSGQVRDVGHDHEKYVSEHPEIFGEDADNRNALRLNWVRLAFWGGVYIVAAHRISSTQLAAAQKVFQSEVPRGSSVQISIANKDGFLSKEEFLTADSQTDLFKAMRGSGGVRASRWRRSALPDSRKFFREFSLGQLPRSVQKALDVLKLTAKMNELSANQFASALKANEQLLQEKIGRTSVDVIRDLNEFVQYDAPPKLQLAMR